MPHDWREELVDDPRVVALDHAERRRHRELSTDPMFVLRTEYLKRQLEKVYAENPKVVTDFFRQFSWPVAPKLTRLNRFLRNIRDTDLRETLQEYAQFANRFRVVFILRKRSPHFETLVDLPNPTKFHVRIEGGQLTPISPTDGDDPVEDSFASEHVEVPRPRAQPIKRGHARYVRVQDCPSAEDDTIDIAFASDQVEVPPPLGQAIKRGRSLPSSAQFRESTTITEFLLRMPAH